MAIVVLVLLFLCCTAKVTGASHRHHPKFQKTDGTDQFKKEVCTSQHKRLREEIIEKSKCGEPKEVFVDLKDQVPYLVVPSMVWVKRCVGLCDLAGTESQCVATKTRMESIPVRIYDSKKDKESCATIDVEVHESCGCCSTRANDCPSPRVYNPRKCSCQCPNMEERRSCLKKPNQNMRWNRSKCTCEPKKRVRW